MDEVNLKRRSESGGDGFSRLVKIDNYQNRRCESNYENFSSRYQCKDGRPVTIKGYMPYLYFKHVSVGAILAATAWN